LRQLGGTKDDERTNHLNQEGELAWVLHWWENQKKPSQPCQATA